MTDSFWFSARLESAAERNAIQLAYSNGVGKWVGCDWVTSFGPMKLNLCGVRARQASLLGSALAGIEAQAWFEARDWLQKVECHAASAENAARQAVMLSDLRDFNAAEIAAAQACEIAAPYQQTDIWLPLLRAIQSRRKDEASSGS